MKKGVSAHGRVKFRMSFTLIELLVVIAIIAILAAMLLPALQQARARAHSTKCMNNLSTLGRSMSFYVNDNKDHFFYWKNNNYSQSYGRQEAFWRYVGANYELSVKGYNEKSKWIYRCPAPKILIGENMEYNYGLNYYWGTWESKHRFNDNKVTRHKQHSKTMWFIDTSARIADFTTTPWVSYMSTVGLNGLLYGRRHNGKGNLVYADGHTGSIANFYNDDNNHSKKSAFYDCLCP